MKERNKENVIRKVTEEIEIKWKTQHVKNKIKIHQKYLKDSNLMKMIEEENEDNKLNKYIEEIIEKYHLKLWKKDNKSQPMDFINFIESEENDKVITAKNWKNFIVNTNII